MLKNLALSLISLLLTLLLLEVGFRLHAYWGDQRQQQALEQLQTSTGNSEPEGRARLKHIIHLSEQPRIVYELKPNLSVLFEHAPITTNAHGYRGPLAARDKPEGTYRIIGLGDSLQFGWGVRDDETYLAVLQRMLNQARPERNWETINTGVPGYNTVQEVATLRERFAGYRPDLVILDYVGNDLELPVFLAAPAPYFTIHRSFFLDFVRHRLEGVTTRQDWRLSGGGGGVLEADRFADTPPPEVLEQVPEKYRDMVGFGAYRSAMQELKRLSRERGFEVLVFTTLVMHPPVRALCEELGFPVLENFGRVRGYMDAQGITRYRGSAMTVHDGHPSALTHRLNAEAIFEYLDGRAVENP